MCENHGAEHVKRRRLDGEFGEPSVASTIGTDEFGDRCGTTNSGEISCASPELHLPYIDELHALVKDGLPIEARERNNATAADNQKARTLCVTGLPKWIDEEELKAIFVRAKESLAELRLGYGYLNQQCVTNVQIVRDPERRECIGYGYVEFIDHATARLILESQSSSHLKVATSNR